MTLATPWNIRKDKTLVVAAQKIEFDFLPSKIWRQVRERHVIQAKDGEISEVHEAIWQPGKKTKKETFS